MQPISKNFLFFLSTGLWKVVKREYGTGEKKKTEKKKLINSKEYKGFSQSTQSRYRYF
jgi:hypothetical protein